MPDGLERALTLVKEATALHVFDADSYKLAASFSLGCAGLRKQIGEAFDPQIKAAHASHKTALEQKKKYIDPVVAAEKVVDDRIKAWRAVEAKKKAEADSTAQSALHQEAQEARLDEAVALDEGGMKEEAQAMIDLPICVPTADVPSEVPQVEGLGTSEKWKFEIENERLIPRDYMMPDEKKIGQYARMMKSGAKMPGVRFFSEEGFRKATKGVGGLLLLIIPRLLLG